jgi:HAD superfamily hydrolase (TIGR01490 family)
VSEITGNHELLVYATKNTIPLDVCLELTHHCNFRCQHCYIPDFLAPDLLSTERVFGLLEELAEMGTLYLTLSGGEMLLRKDWYEIGRRARDLGFALRPLAAHAPADLDRWHGDFMRSRILPSITREARALVDGHRRGGDLCAIITATNSFVTAPIAREFGVEHLVATEPEMREGRFTGRVAGTPCFREGKITRLGEWLAALGRRTTDFAERWCYSDSHNDLPLLELATRPVVVDPDERLGAEARRRGWPIISLRAAAA